jgi:hypothetical protein
MSKRKPFKEKMIGFTIVTIGGVQPGFVGNDVGKPTSYL